MKALAVPALALALVFAGLAALASSQGRGRGDAPPSKPSGSDKPAAKSPGTGDKGRDSGRSGDTSKSGAESDDLATTYFKTCDYDRDGWITYTEAHKSLNIDRKGFAVYDTDVDGRISLEEFTARYDAIKANGGAFVPPIARVDKHTTQKRTPAELLEAFDADHDGALDEVEIAKALVDYGAHDVDAARVVSSADRDGSGRIESGELEAVLAVLEPNSASDHKKAASIEELFDQIEPRHVERGQSQQAARITGPVSTFRRLDYDQTGGISVADLEALQRPLQLPVRIRAVVAVLDTDHDGVLSPKELEAALK